MHTFVRIALLVSLLLSVLSLDSALARESSKRSTSVPWQYDPGPDPADPMQKELIDIIASMPHFPGISQELTGEQKFRLIFGPVFWRMLLAKDSIKILFIGQDATHIAEAAERTATAGFGGRAQDLANYLGVDSGAGFINTYAYTIYGQAASFGTPYVQTNRDGDVEVRFGSLVDNGLWMMTYDQRSPVTLWRNRLIDWIIRNNRGSLRMIVAFGGAARDAIGTFIEAKGGKVETRTDSEEIKRIQVPLVDSVHAGGNNQFPVVLDREGNDLYARLLGRQPDYKNEKDQKAAQDALAAKIQDVLPKLALTGGGIEGSGLIHPGQLGGFDLDLITINGKRGRNIKNLVLSDGETIGRDMVVAEFPHPTRLSNMEPDEAAKAVQEGLADVEDVARAIPADPGFENKFAQGKRYEYGRATLAPLFYSFGTPLSRQVGVSSAVRMRGHSNVIIFGTRNEVDFGAEVIEAATKMKPAEEIHPGEIFTGRPRLPKTRYLFDSGPGLKWARLMKENLDLEAVFQPKPGKSWKEHGIDAFNVKSLPDHGDFGHYRGSFEKRRVLILADPDGADDMITSRALTGMRGQYLQGLMNDIGVGEDHLVIKTVPFGMDGADESEWQATLNATRAYRDKLINAVLDQGGLEAVITDGPYAKAELARILEERAQSEVPVVNIEREGLGNDSGIRGAGAELTTLKSFKKSRISGRRANIPRTHLTFYAHVWEGTSGDSVVYAKDKGRGLAFALIAPEWAYRQKVELDMVSASCVRELLSSTEKSGLMRPGSNVKEFMSKKKGLKPRRAK